MYYRVLEKKEKELPELCVSDSSMPLRHIGVIVIWEGNYNPDNLNIGYKPHLA
jgi:hypothetical protein